MLMILVVFALGWGSQGQALLITNPSEKLVYVKIVDGTKIFVVISGDNYNEYTLQADECGSLSDDGRYLALSSEQSLTLKFIYFPSRKTIYEHTWDENFRHCGFLWRSEDVISLDIIGFDIVDPYFRFDGMSLTEFPIPTSQPIYPDLPNYFPDSDSNLLLRNPANPDIYLYENCIGTIVRDSYCAGNGEAIIYDVANNIEIKELERARLSYMRGYELALYQGCPVCRISEPLVSWSQDGRYVAYVTTSYRDAGRQIPSKLEIIIYDMQTDRYISGDDALYLPNINRNFQWASNNILLVWQTRAYWEVYPYHSSLVFFSFFYADTETSVNGDKPFDVLSQRAIFAPDGRAIAFIGKALDTYEYPDFGSQPYRGDLVIMSTLTGESIIIDTDVTEIITWRSVIDGE